MQTTIFHVNLIRLPASFERYEKLLVTFLIIILFNKSKIFAISLFELFSSEEN